MILYGFWRGGSSCLSLLFTGDLAGHCSALWLVSNCLCITCDIYSHIHISIILYIHMTIILFLFYTLENRFFSTHKFYLVGCFCYVLFCFDLILSPIPLGRVSKRLCGIQPPAGLNNSRQKGSLGHLQAIGGAEWKGVERGNFQDQRSEFKCLPLDIV